MPDPIHTYLDHFRMICPEITEEELSFLASKLNVVHLPPKALYIESGKANPHIGFVVSGLLKAYYIDDQGNQINAWFIEENEYAADYPTFLRQKPATYSIACIEACTIVNLDFNHMQQGYFKYKTLEKYGRIVSEEILIQMQERIESFLFANAEKRYLDFIQNYPKLYTRISLTDLSSFLGIERQSLSRIRKNISKV